MHASLVLAFCLLATPLYALSSQSTHHVELSRRDVKTWLGLGAGVAALGVGAAALHRANTNKQQQKQQKQQIQDIQDRQDDQDEDIDTLDANQRQLRKQVQQSSSSSRNTVNADQRELCRLQQLLDDAIAREEDAKAEVDRLQNRVDALQRSINGRSRRRRA